MTDFTRLRRQIEALEKVSRQLEPDRDEIDRANQSAHRYAAEFLAANHQLPAYTETEDKGSKITETDFSESPRSLTTILHLIEQHIDHTGLNPASPHHFGYIPGGGIFYSALADYLAGITNRYSGVYFASPGAVRVENKVIRWMADLVGFPEDAGGTLTSGGSMANLTAITTARDKYELKGADYDNAVVYFTKQTHHSLQKALAIAGMAGVQKREIRLDDRFRMVPSDLAKTIEMDQANGHRPWLIAASAGTTETGAVDPLQEIGRIARKFRCWFHVDGAYGAFFMLCEEGRKILRGIEGADSVIMDPHKSLFVPYGSGAVLIRDAEAMYRSNFYLADYMQDTLVSREERSPADFSAELTRPFRGLRLWLPLQRHGIAPFRAALAEKMSLARYAHRWLAGKERFEVGPEPDLSVVIFRYLPRQHEVNAFNLRLVKAIIADGRIFVTSTQIDGEVILRLAIVVFRSHLAEVDRALGIIQRTAAEMDSE